MKANKNYSVSEIRSTLASIVSNIFTDTYAQKYQAFMDRNINDPNVLVSAILGQSDKIDVVIGNLLFTSKYYPDNLDTLIRSTPDRVLCGIFLRYNLLTRYLKSLDQSEVICLPSSPDDFYLELMINYWINACPDICS